MTKVLRRLRAPLPAAAAVALAGCGLLGGNAVNTGPFGNGAMVHGGYCGWATPGNVLADGMHEFTNTGPAAATIDSVSLDNPDHLTIAAAYVVLATGHDLYGMQEGYPSAAGAARIGGLRWAQRQRAQGARLPPTHGHDVYNLLLALNPTAHTGTAQAIDIYYTEAGQHYHWQTGFKITVTRGKSCHAQ